MGAADELIDRILGASRIPAGRRRDIQRELRSHIEDFIAAAREAGRDPAEIEQLALDHFGDPGHIAEGFARVYRQERLRLRACTYALGTGLLAISLLLPILAAQSVLAFVFGAPLGHVLASRHTSIEALDILASIAAYMALISFETLFHRRPFPKAVLLLTAIAAALAMACELAALPMTFLAFGLVNGVFLRAVQRSIAAQAARAAIVAVCFLAAGFVSTLMWSPVGHIYPLASWLTMGLGYLLITGVAPRVDAALLHGLERM